MSKSPFTMDFTVRYYEVDRYERCSPMTILDYLQEVATIHASKMNYGFEHIQKTNQAWVINRWSVQMECYPKFRDHIIVATWPSSFEKVTATREFRIFDDAGKPMGCATSRWAYIDLAKRRPTRAPIKEEAMVYHNPERVIDDPFSDIPTSVTPGCQYDYDVHRFDLDSLEHVNNVRYVQWMMKGVSPELLDNYEMNSLEIIYRKEANLGDVLHVHTESLLNHSCLHRITDTAGADVTLARSCWRKWR